MEINPLDNSWNENTSSNNDERLDSDLDGDASSSIRNEHSETDDSFIMSEVMTDETSDFAVDADDSYNADLDTLGTTYPSMTWGTAGRGGGPGTGNNVGNGATIGNTFQGIDEERNTNLSGNYAGDLDPDLTRGNSLKENKGFRGVIDDIGQALGLKDDESSNKA